MNDCKGNSFYLYKNSNLRIPLKLMKQTVNSVFYRSNTVSCGKRRSNVDIYVTHRIKPVTGILSAMTVSVSFQ